MQIETFIQKPPVFIGVKYDIVNGAEITKWTEGQFSECETLEPTQENPSGAFLIDKQTSEKVFPGKWIVRSGDFIVSVDEGWLLKAYYKIQA